MDSDITFFKPKVMKTAEPNDIIDWCGRLYKVIGLNPGHKAVAMESIDDNVCPHCGGVIGKDRMEIIESSPLFQENAEPIKTIKP